MKVKIKHANLAELTPEDRYAINEVLRKSPNATVFHTLEWNELLIDQYGLQNVTLLATSDEKPVGLFIFYIDGARCQSPKTEIESVYGGPIFAGTDRAVIPLLREAERVRRIAWLDIWTPANYDISPFIKSGYTSSEMYTSILELQKPEEELWLGLDGKTRNMVRKATKNNVLVVEGDESLVGEYYQMVVSTLTRAQIEPQPESFYRRIIQDLGPKGMARLLLANHQGRFIAGAIFLFYKDIAYYWHGSSHREHLSVAPNELIQWELIKWARQNGYKYYDLVRIEPDRLPGIARFKTRLGGKTAPCYHLQKGTRRYLWMRLLRLMRNPKRAVNKLRIFVAGKGNANQKNNPQTRACSTS